MNADERRRAVSLGRADAASARARRALEMRLRWSTPLNAIRAVEWARELPPSERLEPQENR